MSQFRLIIDTDNDAFGFTGDPTEVQRILSSVAEQIGYGHTDGRIHDVNGNRVGEYEWVADSEYEWATDDRSVGWAPRR